MLKITGFVLVLLMALLQAFYAFYAFVDPTAFAEIRGTELFSSQDADWVRIYGSRTLFVALIIGVLLYLRNYTLLIFAALIGMVMPAADAWLAFQANAADVVVGKHLATILYLGVTCSVLVAIRRRESRALAK